eukprot:Pgem_evm1s18976
MLVVILVQIYKDKIQSFIPKFVKPVIAGLGPIAPENAREHPAYNDLMACQVKTLSFLAYILRSFKGALLPYKEQLPGFVIHLFNTCPSESASIRKELLMTSRHILGTEFRTCFIPFIDTLLDENVLIGSGRSSYDTL